MTLGRCAQWHNITSVSELNVETLTLDLMRTYDCWLVILMLGRRQKMYEMDIFRKWAEDIWNGIPSRLGENPLAFWLILSKQFLEVSQRPLYSKAEEPSKIWSKDSWEELLWCKYLSSMCINQCSSRTTLSWSNIQWLSSLPTAWRTVRSSNIVLQSCQSTRVTS